MLLSVIWKRIVSNTSVRVHQHGQEGVTAILCSILHAVHELLVWESVLTLTVVEHLCSFLLLIAFQELLMCRLHNYTVYMHDQVNVANALVQHSTFAWSRVHCLFSFIWYNWTIAPLDNTVLSAHKAMRSFAQEVVSTSECTKLLNQLITLSNYCS